MGVDVSICFAYPFSWSLSFKYWEVNLWEFVCKIHFPRPMLINPRCFSMIAPHWTVSQLSQRWTILSTLLLTDIQERLINLCYISNNMVMRSFEIFSTVTKRLTTILRVFSRLSFLLMKFFILLVSSMNSLSILLRLSSMFLPMLLVITQSPSRSNLLWYQLSRTSIKPNDHKSTGN